MNKKDLIRDGNYIWEIPKEFRSDMRVPCRLYASQGMLEKILEDHSLNQLVNVSMLPGIKVHALAMPDIHEGYGFPIGGVAAFDLEEGIISPGGIGYDINCGVRMLASNLAYEEIKPYIEKLCTLIYSKVPSGVGKSTKIKFGGKELSKILEKGAGRIIELGHGDRVDLEKTESRGCLENADPSVVSTTAKERGRDQIGTLGAGNHFIEIERLDVIFDEKKAANLGLFKDQIVVLIHTGSRGLGHQIATDNIRIMMGALSKYKITLADRELACSPFKSIEGQNYFSAMSCGANFAWANRQMIASKIREAFSEVLGPKEGDLNLIYDVAHNIAKIEEHEIDGRKEKVIVHRKGATRAYPGDPVIIPGSMGTGSYLLLGQEGSRETFGSTCHGAGRLMSRTKAKKSINAFELKQELANKGINICAGSLSGLAEEAPAAYKNVDEVVHIVDSVGIAKKIAKFVPLAVIKG